MRLALIDELLAEQRTLTAVEEFSRAHDGGALPADARTYRDLIPPTRPGAGEQYAFEVDVDACTGCKGCVTACHRLNGLEPGETWRRVGQLHGGDARRAVRQTITTACHHCLEPACMSGCPVKAYHKDPVTGIVHHLDDQCIGCTYCLFTCPYEVPQYSASKGIVRKCDMCSDRLAANEAPACVQACPNEAIRIRLVDTAEVARDAETSAFLPAAPDPGVTLPTTTYRSRLALPRNTLPVDYHVVRREAAHPPLVFMLVLTQVAVGLFGMRLLTGDPASRSGLIALVIAAVALAASTAHLGRPHLAFRAVLGLRTSWLSREIVAFGGFVGLTAAHVAALRWGGPELATATGVAAAGVGLLALLSSIMVYAATRRDCWRFGPTATWFTGSAIAGGGAALLAIAALEVDVTGPVRAAATVAALVLAGKLAWEAALLGHARGRRQTVQRRRAELLLGELAPWTQLRFLFGVAGLAFTTGAIASDPEPARTAALAITGAVLTIAGELVERHLFFVAAPAPRMPGESP